MTSWLLVALCLLAIATAIGWRSLGASALLLTDLRPLAQHHVAPPAPTPAAAPPRSTWRIRHDGHVPLAGGVLLFPRTFAPDKKEGYDLVIHFHGNVKIVHESVEQAGINAALAVINLGVGSDKYRLPYDVPGAFEELLADIQAGLVRRGIDAPKLRRVALTAWSAGYGAIESILEERRSPHAHEDPLDAILVLDGVHAGFVDGDARRIEPSTMRVWTRAAQAAADGQLLMLLTHSEIDPGEYAGTMRTHRYLLEQIGSRIEETPSLPMPPRIDVPAARDAVKEHKRMVPISVTRVGMLRVLGFEGITPDHHSAHLTQMGAIALPELAKRWGPVTPPPLEIETKPQRIAKVTEQAESEVATAAQSAAQSAPPSTSP